MPKSGGEKGEREGEKGERREGEGGKRERGFCID